MTPGSSRVALPQEEEEAPSQAHLGRVHPGKVQTGRGRQGHDQVALGLAYVPPLLQTRKAP